MKINIRINDDLKAQTFLSLLKELPFVEIKVNKTQKTKSKNTLNEVFGIWKGRNISAKELRKNSWER